MTNIELVNAINNAIAEGRAVKAGNCRLWGAFLGSDGLGGQHVMGVLSANAIGDSVDTIWIDKTSYVRTYTPAETNVTDIRLGDANTERLPLPLL